MRGLVLALAAACALAAGQARAQSPAYSDDQLALAREVVELSGAEDIMNEMMRALAPQMADQIAASGASREFANRFVELFLEEFAADAPRVMELASVAYAGAFSEAELRDIREFYASPSGRALVARSQEMTSAMTRAGTIIGEQVAQRVLARLEAERRRGPDNP